MSSDGVRVELEVLRGTSVLSRTFTKNIFQIGVSVTDTDILLSIINISEIQIW